MGLWGVLGFPMVSTPMGRSSRAVAYNGKRVGADCSGDSAVGPEVEGTDGAGTMR